MRIYAFSSRTAKEILRDPLNIMFGLGFPVVLILLLSAIQANIPVDLFKIESLAPAILVFGLAFMSLFSATLVAKDRESALLQRLYTTPLRGADYILGYILPIIPIAVLQVIVCYVVAVIIGLPFTVNIIYSILFILPTALFFISLGLLCGSVFTSKQVGAICGALLTNLTAWLSGIWFDLSLVGDVFVNIANLLPFVHAVELERAVLNGNFSDIFPHLLWVVGYTLAVTSASVLMFLRQMKK